MRNFLVIFVCALLMGCGGAFSAADPFDAGPDGPTEVGPGHPDAASDARGDRGETGPDAPDPNDAGDANVEADVVGDASGNDGQADADAPNDTGNGEASTESGADAGCVQGTSRCSGAQLETCENGSWVNSECPFVCTEAGSTASCTGVCSPGSTTCSGQQPEICNGSGVWQQNGAACPFVCTESGGTASCTGSCSPGATSCSGEQPELCNSAGTWQANGAACTYGCSIVSGVATCDAPTCVTDLSNVGTGDFHIAFTLTINSAASQTIDLLNQRSGCDMASTFWDVTLSPSGGIGAATNSTTDAGGYAETGVAGNVNDGLPHRIVVERVSGMLSDSIDGMQKSAPVADEYSFAVLPSLVIGADQCPNIGSLTSHGSISEVCLSAP